MSHERLVDEGGFASVIVDDADGDDLGVRASSGDESAGMKRPYFVVGERGAFGKKRKRCDPPKGDRPSRE